MKWNQMEKKKKGMKWWGADSARGEKEFKFERARAVRVLRSQVKKKTMM